jgi:hypothetical protein
MDDYKRALDGRPMSVELPPHREALGGSRLTLESGDRLGIGIRIQREPWSLPEFTASL